jgi:hypothetical protein
VRAKIAGVVVAFAVLLTGGLYLALDDEDAAQGGVSGGVSGNCHSTSLVEATACF